jgi:hypothetical protein
MTKARRNLVFALVAIFAAAALAYFGVKEAPLLKRPAVTASLVPATWASVRESAGHTAHVGKDKIACSSCHDERDGGFLSLKEAACTSCHAKEIAQTHPGNDAKPTTCLTCHAFGAAPAPTCLGCHANAQGKSAAVAVHISEGSPCTSCHKPHEEQTAVQADCATCHKDVTASHGSRSVSTAVPSHGVGEAGAHVANGTCSDCHAPHAHAADARGACKGCHDAAPQAEKPSGHPACVTCHAPHDLTRGAVKACPSCHQEKRAAITTSHTACKSCHTPHATQTAAAACRTCHEHKATLGAPQVEAHAACASCHKPHDAKASPGAACVTCHAKMAVKHALGRGEKCIDCHAMHPGRGAPLAVHVVPQAGDLGCVGPPEGPRVHGLSQTARFPGLDGERCILHEVPRERDEARAREPRSHGLREVSLRHPQADARRAVRDLPRARGFERAGGPSRLSELPRAARRSPEAGRDVPELPREGGGDEARPGAGRLRHLPSPARTGGTNRSGWSDGGTRVHELP